MKNYFKGVLTGLVIFLCSFIAPNDTLELVEYHRKWQRKISKDKTIRMYGGKIEN